MRDGAAALGRDRGSGGLLLDGPLPPHEEQAIELDDLVRFVEHPVKAFLRQRLGVRVSDLPAEPADELTIEPDGLAKYAIGARLLRAQLSGASAGDALAAERARGQLPPAGALQEQVLLEVEPAVDAILARARAELAPGPAASRDVQVLVDGRRLAGTVVGVAGDTVQAVSYATLKPRHRLAAWVRLLALVAAGEPVRRAVTVGKRSSGAALAAIVVPEDRDPRAWAVAQLAVLIDLRLRGLREPLPLGAEAAAAYAAALGRGPAPARQAAQDAWTSSFGSGGEDRQPEHLLAFGGPLAFERLWTWAPPAADEAAWAPGVPSRFAALATRLWEGPRQWERT
jgi:exodeoxyribonuclease V gamma subunit